MYKELLQAHRAFNKILRTLALGHSRDIILKQIIEVTEDIYTNRYASILLFNEANGSLHCSNAPSLPEFYNEAIEGIAIGPEVGSCGAAAFNKKPVIVEDVQQHPNWAAFKQLAADAGLASCWSVPIMSSNDKVLGTIAIYCSEPTVPSSFELEILDMAAAVCAVAIEKHDIEQELHYSASHDFLTGLLNRKAFYEKLSKQLEQVSQSSQWLAMFYIDINGFKSINDKHGHATGDNILAEFAQKLTTVGAEKRIVGRIGGDEFVYCCEHQSPEALKDVHRRLQQTVGRSLYVGSIPLTSSIGFCMYSSKDCENQTLHALLKSADTKMYQIKQAARLNGRCEPTSSSV